MNKTKKESGQRQLLLAGVSLLAGMAAAPGIAFADPGGLRLTITGADGTPVSDATVSVSSPDSLVTRSGTTDSSGQLRLGGLDPATNYTVSVTAEGYEPFSASNVAVVGGRDLSLRYALGGDGDDMIVVTGTRLAAQDMTSPIVSTTLTLDTLESLPTARSYQSYLQLVPGVRPSASGNPASRSGVNYSDIAGTIGTSTDNLYYLDGVDVTDPTTGTFGANFNSEIIQEQQVLVGGIPAEYGGGAGLVSRVITKSGSNEWHGSINYYLQNDGLVAEDENAQSGGFSTYDTALTLGGPILRDRLWFFGSYQEKNREEDVLDPTNGDLRRTVETQEEYSFGKLTWQVTDSNRLAVSYFSDPFERSGSTSATTPNNRDFVRVQGGDNYKIEYTGDFNNLLVNAYWFSHEGELSNIAADSTIRDNVTFANSDGATLDERQLGGLGQNIETQRNREEWGLNAEYYLETGWGTHTIKAGYSRTENVYAENGSVPGGATYNSLAIGWAGTTFQDYSDAPAGTWTQTSIVQDDMPRIQEALEDDPAYAAALAAVDSNIDGIVSDAELNAYVFSSAAGNPYGNVNVYRALRSVNNPYEVSSEGDVFYLQDTWTLGQLTLNGGVRAERWRHFDSTGEQSAEFDWEYAPRVSAIFDLFGDGRTKLTAFYGRYYDPIRNNMSDFAGALTGPVDEEQVFIGGQWVTFRVRGGATTPDALFAPSTKTPYTDEWLLGFSTLFTDDIGLSVTYSHRETRDILEDFDLEVYSTPGACPNPAFACDGTAYYLPYSYFGYSSAPNSNYVIATLPGGRRDFDGFEVTLTKYNTEDDDWFGSVSYTWSDASGNSNSDSNADFAGDVVWLDPRAPNVYGPQPGLIEHQFKAYAGYEWDFGLEASGVFNWNSGALYTPAALVSGRYFAPRVPVAYNDGGVTTRWLSAPPGGEQNPSYWTFDARFKYTQELSIGDVEFFVDIFNVFDNQAATDEMKLIAGDGVYDFQEATNWVAPRRAYLGVRYSF